MKIIYALLLSCSLLLSLDITPAQLELAKSAGISEAQINQELAKRTETEGKVDLTTEQKVEEVKNEFEPSKEDKKPQEDKQTNKSDLEKISKDKKTELKRYGSLFFNNKNKINPYSLPTPQNYKLTFNDVLAVTIYGSSNQNFTLTVDNNGEITIPKVGKKRILGLSFAEAKVLIAEEIKIAYPNTTNILIDISKFSSIQILVSGLVNNPGIINLSSFSTIKDALLQSGGILNNGSFRNINLKRAGKVVKTFDLYSLVRYGDTSTDTILQNGDVIFVNPISKSISLYGQTNINANFELKKHESFRDLIDFASGFKVSANKNAIQLKRYEQNTQKVYTLDEKQLYKMTPKDGDILRIYPKSTISAKLITLEGNIVAPGEKEIPQDKKLSTLLKNEMEKFGKDSYFLKNTEYKFATVINENKIKTFNLQNLLDGKEEVYLKVWDKIEILKEDLKEFIEVDGSVVDKTKTKYPYFFGLNINDLLEMVEFYESPTQRVDTKMVQVSRINYNNFLTDF